MIGESSLFIRFPLNVELISGKVQFLLLVPGIRVGSRPDK
jgi:hypothetical protein